MSMRSYRVSIRTLANGYTVIVDAGDVITALSAALGELDLLVANVVDIRAEVIQ